MDEPKDRKRKALSEIAAEAITGEGGIVCPKCGCRHFWRVRDTDKIPGGVRRYRECRACGHRIMTTEKKGK